GSVVTVLADHPALRALDQAACGAVLGRVVQQDPRFQLLTTFDRSGRPVCSSAPLEGQSNAAGEPWFRAALQAAAAPPAEGAAPATRASFDPALPLLGPDGQAIGVIHAALSVAWFAERVGRLPMPAGAELIVAEPSGRLLASYPARPGAEA